MHQVGCWGWQPESLISRQGGILGAAQSRDARERGVDERSKSRAETREAGNPRTTAAIPSTGPLSSRSPRAPRPTSSPAQHAAGSPGCARKLEQNRCLRVPKGLPWVVWRRGGLRPDIYIHPRRHPRTSGGCRRGRDRPRSRGAGGQHKVLT